MPDATRSQQPRLLDEVRKVLRLYHYSIHSERSYVEWIVRFVRFHGMRSRLKIRRLGRGFDAVPLRIDEKQALPLALQLPANQERGGCVHVVLHEVGSVPLPDLAQRIAQELGGVEQRAYIP
ncbi:MAG: phage integrase N-terminal SAM-like domain-containing protein [Gammaproteobacteria bacterium]